MFILLTECEAKTRKHKSEILPQLSLILIEHFCVGVEVVLALTLLPSLPHNSDVLLISLDEKKTSQQQPKTQQKWIDLQRGTGSLMTFQIQLVRALGMYMQMIRGPFWIKFITPSSIRCLLISYLPTFPD